MINQKRYVNIVSGVGAGANVAERKLILRVLTQNQSLPPGVVAEFSNAESVGAYFTQQSEEYRRALAYFSFISKNIRSPSLISFARWVSVAIAPTVVGDPTPKALASFAAVTAGTLTIAIGNTAVNIPAINLSQATSLTDVAARVQTEVRKSTNTQLANASVTYNSNTNQFVFTGAVTGSGTITFQPGAAGDISGTLGWSNGATVLVAGQGPDTAAAAIAKSANISNNFGSFVVATPAAPLANADIAEIAAWNHSQNNMYFYLFATLAANASTLKPMIEGYSGCGMNIKANVSVDDFIEQSAAEILAATDYNAPNATNNYMFYQFPTRNVTVSDDTMADAMDALRANYIGVTQSAGQQLAFYQRGLLMGGSTAAVDMNTYANEIWLKSAITARILTMFLALPSVPANSAGRATLTAVIQDVINQAKDNGTISEGKTLTVIQQQYINTLSNDPAAWRQVQGIGYWLNVTFASYVNNNTKLTEWKAVYTLIYSKDDQIRFVEGSDILI